MNTVSEVIVKAKDTPIGEILRPEENAHWLTYIMYASPHLNIDLPTIKSIQAKGSSIDIDTVRTMLSILNSSASGVSQLTDANLEEAYFLAQRDLDKLAIAVYTLYLYGNKR